MANRARATVAEEQSVAAEVGSLAILLPRFIQQPEPELGVAIEALLDRLPELPQFQSDLQTLAAPGSFACCCTRSPSRCWAIWDTCSPSRARVRR